MRTLTDKTLAALRRFPNAPGIRFKVYLAVWDTVTDPPNPAVRLTNVDDLVVQD